MIGQFYKIKKIRTRWKIILLFSTFLFLADIVLVACGPEPLSIQDFPNIYDLKYKNIEQVPLNKPFLLDLPSYDGSNQMVHPDILKRENTYHLAITPYPDGNANLENPSLLESSNGLIFNVPNGVQNPLVRKPPGENSHNCDTDIVYDKKTNQYYIYYIEKIRKDIKSDKWGPIISNNIMFLSSKDRITWQRSNTIEYDMENGDDFVLSPAVVKKDEWHMFYVNSTTRNIEFLSSTSPGKFEKSTSVPVDIDFPPNFRPWHIDIFKGEEKIFYMLVNGYAGGDFYKNHHLYLAHSIDLTNWTFIDKPILKSGDSTFSSKAIYRSTGHVNNGKLNIWFSMVTTDQQWWTGFIRILSPQAL